MVLKKGKQDIAYLYYLLGGILLGLCTHEVIIALVLLNLCVAYQKDGFSYVMFGVSLLLASMGVNSEYLVLYGAFFVLVFVCMKALTMLKVETLTNMRIWNVLFACLGVYALTQDLTQTLLVGGITFILHHFYLSLQNPKEEIQKWIMAFTVSTCVYLLLVLYLNEYQLFLSLFYIIFIAYTMPFNICFFVCVYFSFFEVPLYYLAFLLFMNMNPSKRLLYSLASWGFLVFDFSASAILFAFVSSIAGMFSYQEEEVFMRSSNHIEKSHELYMQHSFYKQFIHYSSIFHDLANYYEDQPQQAQALSLMGDALEYNAKISKNYFSLKEEMGERIKQTLKGYHFSILDCQYFEDDEKVQVKMTIEQLYKNELEEVILPLLEKITQTKLRLTQQESILFHKERLQLCFENEAYLSVETYGASKKAQANVSGDSFHTFQLEQGLVCMLSDGMGQGEKAQKISSLLIKIMETMLRCDIPQVECVKLINQFLRSDMYATLDVLSFDRKKNKAYLSKSASAPTYLLRDGELFEMSAHSLPIGIVDNIQANVFELSYGKGDIFIMTSDGIQKEEVERWQALKRCTQIKNEGLNLMNIIKQKERFDDSTILMVKVQ